LGKKIGGAPAALQGRRKRQTPGQILQAVSGRSIDPKKDRVSIHFSVPSGNEDGIEHVTPAKKTRRHEDG
jgi:hypothetical protein